MFVMDLCFVIQKRYEEHFFLFFFLKSSECIEGNKKLIFHRSSKNSVCEWKNKTKQGRDTNKKKKEGKKKKNYTHRGRLSLSCRCHRTVL